MQKGICHYLFTVVFWACIASVTWSSETMIYVDAAATGANDGVSWTDAYRDLQDALAEAAEVSIPVQIRVAQGLYRPDDNEAGSGRVTSTFELHNNVTLAGGYAGVVGSDPDVRDVERCQTVLSGDLAGDDHPNDTWDSPNRQDNCRHVVTANGTDETTVLDGFTVTAGAAYGLSIEQGNSRLCGCRFLDNGGAGIHASEYNGVLADCTFERNGHAKFSRGGLYGGQGHLRLTDCVFLENDGGGIDTSGSLDLLRCSFVANRASRGAAIDCWGDMTVRHCSFRGNQGRRDGAVKCHGTATLSACTFTGNSSGNVGAIAVWGTLNLLDCEFIGNAGESGPGAVMIMGDMLTARGCVFAGNTSHRMAGALTNLSAAILRLSNCTFTGNRGQPNAVEHAPIPGAIAEMTQCIVWDGPDPFTKLVTFPPEIVATYSNIQGGYAGEGNIDVNPRFVAPGYWETNTTPIDANDDVWVTGDYHLKSQAGHWNQDSEGWVRDDTTSSCIDAGNPNGPLGAEPFPNGGFVNLGAYGGTSQASRSYFGTPVCETRIAGDINGDCTVDDLDLDILMSHWLMEAAEPDNVPPSITLISPTEGAEFTAGMPMMLRAEASDPDGAVIRVHYMLTSRSENGVSGTGATATDPTDDWQVSWDGWSKVTIAPDRTYTIQGEAMDDQGAKTLTPEVEIKLNPQRSASLGSNPSKLS